MQQIEASVVVYLKWNDEANEWEVDEHCGDGHPLDWNTSPHVYDDENDHAEPTTESAAALGQATGRDGVTLEELGFMLGSGLIRQHVSAGAPVPPNGLRPIHPALIDMVDGVIDDTMPVEVTESPTKRAALLKGLLPVFASVDENAFRRGKHAATPVGPVKW